MALATDTVYLRLPTNTHLPVPARHWMRMRSGKIEATYTIEELAWALVCIGHAAGSRRLAELREEEKVWLR